jgi:predicted transposase YdaD
LKLGKTKEWLNVELPRTQNRRVDLLCRTTDGRLVQIELQATNDPLMGLRMAEYGLAVRRMYSRYPEQIVLYVGNQRLRMKAEFREGGMVCQYRLVDIRHLDGSALLASGAIADNILAMLARLDNPVRKMPTILSRIASLKKSLREPALQQFLLTCQIRGLESAAIKEIRNMADFFELDIDKWPFLKDAHEKGCEKGREEGIKEVLHLALKKRFGRLPAAVTKRVAAMSPHQAQEMVLAILDAGSLKDLFGAPAARHR